MKTIFMFILGLSLARCSSANESEQIDVAQETSSKKKDDITSSDKENFADEVYQELAPENWELREASGGAGSFFIRKEHDDKREGRLLRGVIALDGRFESLTSPFRFRTVVIRQGQKKYADVAPNYPDVEGFEKAVVSPRQGYSTKLKMELRELRYLNREHGIYCGAYNPGSTRCFWGDEIVRFGLFFDSRDTVEALSYLSSICFQGAGCPSRQSVRNDLPRVNEEIYRDLTPPDWQLNISTGGAAAFTVKAKQSDGPQGLAFDGTIALDDRFVRVESPVHEWMESPWRSWPRFYEFVQVAQKRHAAIALDYPDVEGFEKAVVFPDAEYHGKSGRKSDILVYLNREYGIYCRSHNPGKARCFWGDENVRYGLNFDSLNTGEALDYLSSLLIDKGNS